MDSLQGGSTQSAVDAKTESISSNLSLDGQNLPRDQTITQTGQSADLQHSDVNSEFSASSQRHDPTLTHDDKLKLGNSGEGKQTKTSVSHARLETGDTSRTELTQLGFNNSACVAPQDEPVLTLYRRHSEDPFLMYNALNKKVHFHSNSYGTNELLSKEGQTHNPSTSDQSSGKPRCEQLAKDGTAVDATSGGHEDTPNPQPGSEGRSMSRTGRDDNNQLGTVSPGGVELAVKTQKANKMVKMQSPRVQCCLCAVSVMSALFGMFMLSAGVCLVLNYNFLDVDTSGLPPNLHNEEGKKVVGIILICVGIAALGVSGLVSALYFTACSSQGSSSTPAKAGDQGRQEAGKAGEGRPSNNESQGRHHGNGTARGPPAIVSSSGPRRSGTSAVPSGRRTSDPRVTHPRGGVQSRNSTPPGSARPYRHGKKNRHGQSRFKNSLPSHPEEAGGDSHSLHESRRSATSSASRRLAYPDRSGHVNEGAHFDDDLDRAREDPDVSSSKSSITTPVITVDSSFVEDETEPSHPRPTSTQQHFEADLTQRSSAALGSNVTCSESESGAVQESAQIQEGGGRDSRLSTDSIDTSEGSVEGVDDARKRLDNQMQSLIS